ncbi:MAG: hypothetical protein ABSD63_14890 [Candidatus Korobacteraceae bacterium]|jgi:hypothetical protein
MWITWRHQDVDLVWPITVEQKIDIFYEQVWGWQLHVADLIANGGCPLGSEAKVGSIPHSGFAVLQICLSYFETIGKYRGLATGDGAQFKAGAQMVLPDLQNVPREVREKLLEVLYRGARCGLYHNSRTCRGVGLGQPQNGEAMAYDPDAQVLVISPERLPRALKSHLERYRTELLDPINDEARKCFVHQFDKDFGVK